MRNLLLFLSLLASTAAFAAEQRTSPLKDMIVFPVPAMGNVEFFHKAHAFTLGCKSCHDPSLAPLVTDKDAGHKLCKGCHIEREQGPMRCPSCHKKP